MYERVNINCAEVNSTRQMGSGIYFFISVEIHCSFYEVAKLKVLCYNFSNTIGVDRYWINGGLQWDLIRESV